MAIPVFFSRDSPDGRAKKLNALQPRVPALTALATLDASLGLVEQTGVYTFAKRAMGVATAASVLTRADGDGRFAPISTIGLTDGDKGDITVSGSGLTWVLDAGAVTLAKQADMATASVVYRKSAGAGAPEVQTLATLKTDLGLTGTNSGDQASIVGITGTIAQFNTAITDGDMATGGGTATGSNTGDQTITLTTDVTGSGTGSFATTIANSAVTLAKMADVATATVFYRKTAAAGAPEVQTLATLKTDLGLTGTNSGDQTSIVGISGTLAQFNTAITDADIQPLDPQLTDLAALTYAANALKVVRVNAGETAFELATIAGGGGAAGPSLGLISPVVVGMVSM